MNRAHPVLVFKPMPLFTSPHSFGTCIAIKTASLLAFERHCSGGGGRRGGGEGAQAREKFRRVFVMGHHDRIACA